MTVSTTLNKVIYPGSGAQTTFSFSFAFPGGTATQEAANILVFFTDTLGNITQLIQGLGTTNYQITFNPASGTNPTPVGGIITYNPNAVPIALGTFLTILRSLPLTQATSLQNQGTLYQPVTEAALDYEMMISQQVLEVQSRALVVPISDPTPTALPAKAARANGVLGFDSQGNPITVLTAPAGTISGAMQPVVSAASLAAGRTAFGLGAVAVENIGAGLTDDGSGNLRVFFQEDGISTPQSVGPSNHLFRYLCFANITFTLARANTLFNGFGFWVTTQGFTATLVINAADTFFGATTGQSLVIGPGQTVYVTTDTVSSWFADFGNPISYNSPLNLNINASVSGSALTIALKDRNGNDPSATSPIIVGFFGQSGPVSRAVSGALSITIPNGATLGTVNGQANRIWIGLFDNAGTPVLGVYNSLFVGGSGSFTVISWDETSAVNSTAISAGSTNPQTWYTNGAVTGKNFRILGYIESAQPTAGAWTASLTKTQIFGSGVKKPGDVVQSSIVIPASGTSTSVTFAVITNQTSLLSVSSASNLVFAQAMAGVSNNTNSTAESFRFSRGTVANTNLFGNGSGQVNTPTLGSNVAVALMGYDLPNVLGNVTYAVQGLVTAGNMTYGGTMLLQEIFI